MGMRLQAKMLGIESGGAYIVLLNRQDADDLGIASSDRVLLKKGGKSVVCIVDTTQKILKPGFVGIYYEVEAALRLKQKDVVDIKAAGEPESIGFIKQKIDGISLDKRGMMSIVKDTVDGHLSNVELTAFVSALNFRGMNPEEAFALAESMVYGGQGLKLGRKVVCDKHSLGGVPGDKTTILVVPMVAAAGLTIPKTSSRAITSAAGTADRVECLCPVSLELEEIRRVVRKTNGCMVWGGSVNLAPADDLFIRVEYPLSIDPLLLPSVMSKKKAVGATHVVIDLPTGRGAKLKTIGEAHKVAKNFISLGSRLKIRTKCAITYGEQPIGCSIGPALEAREALETICNLNGARDLVEKAIHLSGMLFEMNKMKNGKEKALEILKSGKAEKKLREIIDAQGGNPKIRPSDIPVGEEVAEVRSDAAGRVFWVSNHDIVRIARAAGSPKDKGAGVILKKKVLDAVRKGDVVMEIYAEKAHKLDAALELAQTLDVIGLFKTPEQRMLIDKVPSWREHKKSFIIER